MTIPSAPPLGASGLDGVELVVVGGGLLGGAIARVAASAGARVTIASPHPRPHAAFWRRYEIGPGPFPAWIPRDARVVVAVAPAPGGKPADAWNPATQRFIATLARGGRRVTLCGPGAGAPAFEAIASVAADVQVVRLAPLFGVGDRLCWPLVQAMREGRPGRLPRSTPDVWALHADDAARAILTSNSAALQLRGPERLSAGQIASTLADRYGGTWSRVWGRTSWHAEDLALAAAQTDVEDGWDESQLGPRTTLRAWADRLPGPRRRR